MQDKAQERPTLKTKKDKKKAAISRGFKLNLAVPTLPVRYQTSTIGAVDFTSVFGMGTGVSPQLSPPGNFSKISLCLEMSQI